MFNRYNIELTPDYLNNVCTADNRYGMYPTIEMIEMYNTINFRNSILPSVENSQLRALFAEIIPTTADNLFALNRFKKLVGYKNNMFPLSKRFPSLQEISTELTNITTVHDIANYDKFARMLQVILENNDIPVSFNRVEQWETEKTDTPNETVTTESERTNTSNTTDSTEKTETGTYTKTGTEATAKTGTETTAINETNTKTGTESTTANNTKSINETVTQKIAPFDSDSYNNNEETTTTNNTNDNGTSTTTYNTSDAKTGNDVITHATTDTTTFNTTNTDNTDTTTDRTIANTDNSEKTETKTKTGENEATENGKRLINTGLSMAELIERENILMPVFDMYLMSIAREITLTCVDEVW